MQLKYFIHLAGLVTSAALNGQFEAKLYNGLTTSAPASGKADDVLSARVLPGQSYISGTEQTYSDQTCPINLNLNSKRQDIKPLARRSADKESAYFPDYGSKVPLSKQNRKKLN
ncbi:hypothetical protein DSO57_1005153 [Entomophthora muscae]|uniref:Uncharacterized protein n=1 Tax=Entomophthora muscae TaxID=34485 RepID=A0ACC2TVE4_9FUNG|nr:hypothetical protein DSO57_1005153 [Entomophthora muscae]